MGEKQMILPFITIKYHSLRHWKPLTEGRYHSRTTESIKLFISRSISAAQAPDAPIIST